MAAAEGQAAMAAAASPQSRGDPSTWSCVCTVCLSPAAVQTLTHTGIFSAFPNLKELHVGRVVDHPGTMPSIARLAARLHSLTVLRTYCGHRQLLSDHSFTSSTLTALHLQTTLCRDVLLLIQCTPNLKQPGVMSLSLGDVIPTSYTWACTQPTVDFCDLHAADVIRLPFAPTGQLLAITSHEPVAMAMGFEEQEAAWVQKHTPLAAVRVQVAEIKNLTHEPAPRLPAALRLVSALTAPPAELRCSRRQRMTAETVAAMAGLREDFIGMQFLDWHWSEDEQLFRELCSVVPTGVRELHLSTGRVPTCGEPSYRGVVHLMLAAGRVRTEEQPLHVSIPHCPILWVE